jgi:hypothetical protein
MNYKSAMLPVLGLFFVDQMQAQVANDDCAGALGLGVALLASQSNTCDLILPMGYLILDSTDQALVNYPYPVSPAPCMGYSTTVTAPGKDRWYAVRVNCQLVYTVECTDTCNLSVWSGGNCTFLEPVACHTILPNTPTMGTVIPTTVLPSEDTLLIQISSQGPSRDIAYRICLTDPSPSCLWTATTWNGATSVLCFDYDVQATPATSASSADGIAQVLMLAGNAPYTILWDDGDTGFTRSDLPPGLHVFTITDAQGCQEEGTIQIGVALSTGVAGLGQGSEPRMVYDLLTGTLLVSTAATDKGTITVHDALGRIEQRITIRLNEQRIDLSGLPNAAHVVVWRASGFVIAHKLVLP